MIKLQSPKSQLWLSRGATHCPNAWTRLQDRCRDHPFNHAVEVFIPHALDLPAELEPPLPHYYTSRLPLSRLVRPDVCSAVPSWRLAALSHRTRVDTDSVYAVLPSGKLILSVDKDTYEEMGLVGKPSHFQKNHRFIVEVDLTAPHFRPGKPNYSRVEWSLSERLTDGVDFIMCCSPEVNTTEDYMVSRETKPSNTVSMETTLSGRRHGCVREKILVRNFLLPTVHSASPHGSTKSGENIICSSSDLYMWLGTLACGLDLSRETPSDYVSTYRTPEPHSECRYGVRVRWSGMVHSDWICDLLTRAKEYITGEQHTGTVLVPWIAVSIWGFEDSPISWYPCEHGSYLWGDNHYTVLLFPDGNYWTLTSFGSHDIVR